MQKLQLTPEIIAASRKRPDFYLENVLGLKHSTPYQLDIGRALASNEFQEVAARSANGVGKSFIAACFANWWFDTRYNGWVIIAGPGLRNAKETFKTAMELRANSIFDLPGDPMSEHIELAAKWKIQARAASSPESFAGAHAPGGVLLIMEEASGQKDAIYAAAYGCITSPNDKALHIGNPTQQFGTFASLWKDKTGNVKTMTISAMDSPNVQARREVIPGVIGVEGVDRLISRFGKDSDTVRVRVHGLPPIGSGNGVFSFAAIESAKQRGVEMFDGGGPKPALDPVIVGGLDIARLGADKCALFQITSGVVDGMLEWEKKPIDETAQRAANWLDDTGPSSILYIDVGGMGVGVYDILRADPRYASRVFAVDFGGKQTLGKQRINRGEYKWTSGTLKEGDTPMYADRRSELWVEAAEWTAKSGVWHPDLPDGLVEELEADLQAVELDPGSASAFRIEKKIKTKERLGHSPDFGDAYCLAVMALIERGRGARRKTRRVPARMTATDSYQVNDDGRRKPVRRQSAMDTMTPRGVGLGGML